MIKAKHSRCASVIALLIFFIFTTAVKAEISSELAGDELLKMLPAESLFCVRVNNLDNSLGQIDQFLTGISPMPMFLSMTVRGQLAKLLGSPELTGLNMNGSFAIFAVPTAGEPTGPKQSDMFIGVLAPVTDYKKFIDGNPNMSQPDANGISKFTSGNLGGVLIKQVGNYALIAKAEYSAFAANAKSLFAAEAGGLAGVLDADEVNRATKEPLWAYGNVQLVSKVFGPLIFGKIEEIKKLKGQLSNQQAPELVANVMNMYATVFETLLKETKSLSLTVRPEPNVCNMAVSISALPGTNMANIFVADASAGQENKLLNYLENGTMMNFACKMNTPFWKLYAACIDLMPIMMGEGMPAEEIAKLKALVENAAAALGDSAAGSFSVDVKNKPPFTGKYVVAVKNPEKFNQLIEESVQIVNTGAIANFYKSMNFETSFTMKRAVDNYKGVSIDSSKFVMKSTEPNSPQGQMINAMYGEGFDYRWAIVDGLYVCVMGGDVDSAIRELIDQVKAGGPKQLADETKAALSLIPQAGKADFVGTYNFLRWFKIIGAVMPVPVPIPQMDIPTKSNIVFAVKIANGKMTFEIALPKQHLMEMMGMFQMIQQQQQMQKKGMTTTSAQNLRLIGLACLRYAKDYDDKFPPNLQVLVEKYDLSPEDLKSPLKPEGFDGPSYIYVEGQNTKMEPGNILVYENPAFCTDMINVFLLDSHVQVMRPNEFLRELEVTYKRLGREMPEVKFKVSPEAIKK